VFKFGLSFLGYLPFFCVFSKNLDLFLSSFFVLGLG